MANVMQVSESGERPDGVGLSSVLRVAKLKRKDREPLHSLRLRFDTLRDRIAALEHWPTSTSRTSETSTMPWWSHSIIASTRATLCR